MSHSNKRKDPPLSPGGVEAKEFLEKTVNGSCKKQKQGDQLGGEPLPGLPQISRKYPPLVITPLSTANFMAQVTSLSGWEAHTGVGRGASKPS